jgi:hypothetical protein
MNILNNKKDPHLLKAERPGVSGLNHLWDGPLDVSGYPMQKGSSSGKNGIKLKKYPCGCDTAGMPITQKVKQTY